MFNPYRKSIVSTWVEYWKNNNNKKKERCKNCKFATLAFYDSNWWWFHFELQSENILCLAILLLLCHSAQYFWYMWLLFRKFRYFEHLLDACTSYPSFRSHRCCLEIPFIHVYLISLLFCWLVVCLVCMYAFTFDFAVVLFSMLSSLCGWICLTVNLLSQLRKKMRVRQTPHRHISYTIWTITFINVYYGWLLCMFFFFFHLWHCFYATRRTHTDK